MQWQLVVRRSVGQRGIAVLADMGGQRNNIARLTLNFGKAGGDK